MQQSDSQTALGVDLGGGSARGMWLMPRRANVGCSTLSSVALPVVGRSSILRLCE